MSALAMARGIVATGGLSRLALIAAGAVAMTLAGFHLGGWIEAARCDERIEAAQLLLISRINEDENDRAETAERARRRAVREHDAGRVPDDPYRRD